MARSLLFMYRVELTQNSNVKVLKLFSKTRINLHPFGEINWNYTNLTTILFSCVCLWGGGGDCVFYVRLADVCLRYSYLYMWVCTNDNIERGYMYLVVFLNLAVWS